MKYAEILRAAVATLEAERAALKAEADTLHTDETRTAEQVGARADEIIVRSEAIKAEIAEKLHRADSLDAIEAERASVPKSPAFIPAAEKADVADVARMNHVQATDVIVRNAEESGIDPTHARTLLKRHRNDMAWVRNLAARSTDIYTSAWIKCVTGREAFLTSEERAAVAVGTNTQGGLLVPTHLDPTLIMSNDGTTNAIRAISRVVTLTSEKTWNGVSTAGSSFSWDGELVEVSDDSPSFVAQTIPTYKGQGFIQASMEAFEDIPGLASDVLMLFADGRDRLEATAHATGAGSTEPTGIFTALDANTNVESTSATAATLALVDLTALKRSVGPRWRGKGTWLMNPVYADAIRALGTAVSASFSGDITGPNTASLLGRPVVESDEAPSAQTTTVRDNEIVFGDFSNYVIVDKPGSTSVEFIPHLFNTTTNLPDGRRGWLMHFRSGADSVNDTAFQLLQDKTSA